MLGLFSRRPRPDPQAVARLKGWIADLMTLSDRDHIAIAELACHEPGCPDLETVVTLTLADRRRFVLRFPSAVVAVTRADVALLGAQVAAGPATGPSAPKGADDSLQPSRRKKGQTPDRPDGNLDRPARNTVADG